MAPPMPPAPVRGLLLLLAALAGQLQRGSRAGAGRRSRAQARRVGERRNGSAGGVRLNRGHFWDAGAFSVQLNRSKTDKAS